MKSFILLLFLAWFGTASAAEKQLTGEADKLKETMRDLFEVSKKVNDAAEAEKKKSRVQVENALDWDRIAKDCLGKNWAKAPAKVRTEFKTLLQEVIVRTAYGRLDKFWGETKKYEFEKVEVKGKTAHVATKFFVGKEDFLLEYFLSKSPGGWKIYDVAYEDLRYSENISEQINAFMKENSYTSLLEKLRKRRDELRDEDKKPKKG